MEMLALLQSTKMLSVYVTPTRVCGHFAKIDNFHRQEFVSLGTTAKEKNLGSEFFESAPTPNEMDDKYLHVRVISL